MGTCRLAAIQTRPTEVLDWTRLTVEACREFVPPCEAAFHAPRAGWRREGRPRPARR